MPPEDVTEITIKHCNSVAEARVSLRRSSLNIKYGPNGIGKSTIARALVLRAQGDADLEELVPFKYRHGGDHPSPSVSGADDIGRVLVFDESYVAQFTFQADEVVKNSFEIFINTPEYQDGLAKIESIFERLKAVFFENKELDEVISNLTRLRDAFTLTKGGAIAKTSRGVKALTVGGKLTTIPKPLRGYERFLRSDDPAGWITWQAKGREYLTLSDNCPFCSIAGVDKQTAELVATEYESAAVRNMSALRETIKGLRAAFEPEHLEQLEQILGSIGELSPEQGQFLVAVRMQVETLLGKFTALKGLSFHTLRDSPDVEGALREAKIDLGLLRALNSEDTQYVVSAMNDELDQVAAQIAEVKARVGEQRTRVARLIARTRTTSTTSSNPLDTSTPSVSSPAATRIG